VVFGSPGSWDWLTWRLEVNFLGSVKRERKSYILSFYALYARISVTLKDNRSEYAEQHDANNEDYGCCDNGE
jgi:hypothetical protein